MNPTLTGALMVGLGGFLGSSLRYLVGALVQRASEGALFPYATLAVNALGCFLIGLLIGLGSDRPLLGYEGRLFLLVGVLGGFTTFSTFGYETFALARDGAYLLALGNVGAQLLIGLAAVSSGHALGRMG